MADEPKKPVSPFLAQLLKNAQSTPKTAPSTAGAEARVCTKCGAARAEGSELTVCEYCGGAFGGG